jgi:membrane-bound lytic murein transglycosylase D
LVPVSQAKAFKKNLAMLPYSERVTIKPVYEERVATVLPQERNEVKVAGIRRETPRATFTDYKVKPEQNFASFANRNNSAIKPLRQVNYMASNSSPSGKRLETRSQAKSSKDIPLLATVSKTKSVNTQVYAVKKGDTFFNISQRFSVTPKDIANWNNITLKTALIPGRKLTIKSVNPQLASASSSIRLISYTVGKGDSLLQISRKFNVSVADLRKSNAATLVRGLQPGQKLKIIVDNNQSSS